MKNKFGETDKFKSMKVGSREGRGIYSDEARPNLEALEKKADEYVMEAIQKLAMTDSSVDFTLDTPDNIRHLRVEIMNELEHKHKLSYPFDDPDNILKKQTMWEKKGELLNTYYTGRIDRVLRTYLDKMKEAGYLE